MGKRKLNMFVRDQVDEVSDNKGNVIVIRRKMNFAAQSRVQQELYELRMEFADANNPTMMVSMGLNNLALLRHNIVRWRGPAFDGVPCTKANIDDLDPTEPLIEKVLEKIGKNNQPATAEPRNEEEAQDPKRLASSENDT